MNPLLALTLSALLATVSALILVRFLHHPLRVLLGELCGNDARAAFWSAYSSVVIVLAALFGLMVAMPLGQGGPWEPGSTVPLVLAGLRASLCAALMVLGLLAVTLLRSIGRFEQGQRPTRGHRTRDVEPAS